MTNYTDPKTRSPFMVTGPNLADGRMSRWFYDNLNNAKAFAVNMAEKFDAEYDIYEYVAMVRQVPPPPRPVEFITLK